MVYVDKPFHLTPKDPQAKRVGARWGQEWCHLWADTVEELIPFAKTLGMKKEWLHKGKTFPHFDLVPSRRERAVKLGAQEVSLKDWIRSEHDISRDL